MKRKNKIFKKPLSKREAQDKMEKLEIEKGDTKAMIIAAFLVFTPALVLVVGIIIGVILLIF